MYQRSICYSSSWVKTEWCVNMHRYYVKYVYNVFLSRSIVWAFQPTQRVFFFFNVLGQVPTLFMQKRPCMLFPVFMFLCSLLQFPSSPLITLALPIRPPRFKILHLYSTVVRQTPQIMPDCRLVEESPYLLVPFSRSGLDSLQYRWRFPDLHTYTVCLSLPSLWIMERERISVT